MIDLNSRSGLSDRINFYVDQAANAASAAEDHRGYLGASILGGECERAVQLQHLDKFVPSARLARIFERGHLFEAAAIAWLRRAGFVLVTEDHDGGQFGFSILGGRVRGHADGILAHFRGGNSPLPLPALWECKGLGSKGWKQLVKDKVREAYPKYFGQMQLYMGELGLAQGILTAVNADTMELHHELVAYDPQVHASLVTRAERILVACDLGEILPRAFLAATDYRCRMCSYAGPCWSPA